MREDLINIKQGETEDVESFLLRAQILACEIRNGNPESLPDSQVIPPVLKGLKPYLNQAKSHWAMHTRAMSPGEWVWADLVEIMISQEGLAG